MGSQVFCNDCHERIAPTHPRVVHSAKGFDQYGKEAIVAFYVCSACEYARVMNRARVG